jgi:prepilin-type N-terminal cleavage/methylation domain-containing protein
MKLLSLNQRGQTLVEVVIGVAILSLVMASATTVAVNSSKSGTDSYDQLRASELAEEGIEAIHNYRDEWIRTNPMADLSSQVTKWQMAYCGSTIRTREQIL